MKQSVSLHKLTSAQSTLLRRLPDAPSDGIGVKGATYRVAANLRDRGLARVVGRSDSRTYFVRTEAGEALISDHDAVPTEKCKNCGEPIADYAPVQQPGRKMVERCEKRFYFEPGPTRAELESRVVILEISLLNLLNYPGEINEENARTALGPQPFDTLSTRSRPPRAELEKTLATANALIGEAADEASCLQARIDALTEALDEVIEHVEVIPEPVLNKAHKALKGKP